MHVMPSDHMSTRSSYWPLSMARITSGAIQYGVPTNVFAGLATDAEPKSATKKQTEEVYQQKVNKQLRCSSGYDSQSLLLDAGSRTCWNNTYGQCQHSCN